MIQDIMISQHQYIIQINIFHNIMLKNITAFFTISSCIIGFIIVFVINFKHIRQNIINSKIKELNEE